MPRGMQRLANALQFYRNASLVLFSAFIIVVVVNGALAAWYWATDHESHLPWVVATYGEDTWADVYPGMERADILQMLDETWSRRLAYRPFSQVQERAFTGEFVNVSQNGFRVSIPQGPWPPQPSNFNVFLFGGSTTFGYGVQDADTIASCLQASLDARTERTLRIYNFGAGYHRSTQGRARFEELLIAGHVPDMAVFIDGLNDFAFYWGPAQTSSIAPAFDGDSRGALGSVVDSLSITRAVRTLLGQDPPPPAIVLDPRAPAGSETEQDRILQTVLDRYVANLRLTTAIGESFGVQTVFVWQPVPTYKYDLRHHPYAEGGFGINRRAAPGYKKFARHLERTPLGSNFLWCADMQESLEQPLYVDKMHYTASMNRLLGEIIAAKMEERGLLGG